MHINVVVTNGNGTKAVRLYKERCTNRALPDQRTFQRLHWPLIDTGSFLAERHCVNETWNVITIIDIVYSWWSRRPTWSEQAHNSSYSRWQPYDRMTCVSGSKVRSLPSPRCSGPNCNVVSATCHIFKLVHATYFTAPTFYINSPFYGLEGKVHMWGHF